jgi:hypothetical protein
MITVWSMNSINHRMKPKDLAGAAFDGLIGSERAIVSRAENEPASGERNAMGNVMSIVRDEEFVSAGDPAVVKAVSLMKEALEILDRGGAGLTTFACHLSLAIDVAEERPVATTEEEFEAMWAELPAPLYACSHRKM